MNIYKMSIEQLKEEEERLVEIYETLEYLIKMFKDDQDHERELKDIKHIYEQIEYEIEYIEEELALRNIDEKQQRECEEEDIIHETNMNRRYDD